MPAGKKYDVIIVGAGPAGLFAALELVEHNGLKILLIEKGRDLPVRDHRDPSQILCGWGGAGAYSDGKLNLSTQVGGQLLNYIPEPALIELIEEVDQTYLRFGASSTIYGDENDAVSELRRQSALAGLSLAVSRIRHIGTEVCFDVLSAIRGELLDQIDFIPDMMAERLIVEDGRVTGVATADGKEYSAGAVIVAPGREGAEWLASEVVRLGLPRENNPVDIGVRVETSAAVMQPLTDVLYESKFYYNTKKFDDMIRTFCMCPNGAVALEKYKEVITVNGHSYSSRKTDNTNFAVLVSTNFTRPFNEPIAYGKYVASLANLLGDGVIVQRLGDLRNGRRSTPRRMEKGAVRPTLKNATPGDLSFVLPYRHLQGILEMLEALDRIAPGVNSKSTLLYGVEVKFYSSRVALDENLQTPIENLYAIGDGAGITRGLVQASVSGIAAARSVLRKGRA